MAYAEAVVETKVTVTTVELTLSPMEAVTLRRLLYCHVAGVCGPGSLRGHLDEVEMALRRALAPHADLSSDSSEHFYQDEDDAHHNVVLVQ